MKKTRFFFPLDGDDGLDDDNGLDDDQHCSMEVCSISNCYLPISIFYIH